MKTVKITLVKIGKVQVYNFKTEQEAKWFYLSRLYLEPTYKIELI